MPVVIDNENLSPAPLVEIVKQNQLANDGTFLGQTYQLTLRGNLVAVPPGGTPVAEPARLGVLLDKQNDLVRKFSKDGKTLEIYSPDGSNIIKCNPRVISIDFAEGIWVDRTEYTIVLEAPWIYEDDYIPEFYVTDTRDQWQIEESGFTVDSLDNSIKQVWQVTHTLGATGQTVYDENGQIDSEKVAWKQARDWVIKKLETSNFDTTPFDTKGEMNILDGGQKYNHTRLEDIDTIGGSFSLTEKWIIALGVPATEDYTISIKRSPEDNNGIEANISGTIYGLSTGINDLQSRILNATTYFNNSVKPNLFDRANALAGNVLSDYGVTGSIDYNSFEGTISYNYDFNSRETPSGVDTVYDSYVVSKKTSVDEIETTVTVQGTVTGRLKITDPQSFLLKFERAKNYWDVISNNGTLLERANVSGVPGLKPSSLQESVDYNFSEGSISYTYDFDNRDDDNVRNEYTVNMRSSREDSRTVVSVEGTITGLRQNNDPIIVKYQNALNFWETWVFQIPNIASEFVPSISLNPQPSSISRGDSRRQGIINYNYEYDTDAPPTIPGALSEQITITDNKPSDVFAAITVLGRPEGPILQDIGSKKEKSRTVSLEVIMAKGYSQPNTDALVNSHRPNSYSQLFVDRDEESWAENQGRYTRTITWIFE